MTTRIPKLNDSLTPRETSVLDGIVAGQSTKQIARTLGISPQTIQSHRAYIRAKLGARNTADIVRIALMRRSHAINLARQDA